MITRHKNTFKPFFTTGLLLLLQLTAFGQILEFERTSYDFGKHTFNKHFIEKEIEFRNTGKDTLFITSIDKTPCDGCDSLILLFTLKKYSPGARGKFYYRYNNQALGKHHVSITFQTNSRLAASTSIEMTWETLPETPEQRGEREIREAIPQTSLQRLERRVWDNKNLNDHLSGLSGCYYTYRYVMPMLGYDYDAKNRGCDSLRKLAVDEMDSLFTNTELADLVINSAGYYDRLIAFEAFARSASTDRIVSVLESVKKTLPDHYLDEFDEGIQLYNLLLSIVYPLKGGTRDSHRIDLETYVYLHSFLYPISITNYSYISLKIGNGKSVPPPTFRIIRNDLNFGQINLGYHPAEKNVFELRGKILVENLTNKLIVIAPYYDSTTRFEQKSYRIPAKCKLEIPFKSNVSRNQAKNPVKRSVKLVNYQTKQAQVFTFEALFINEN